MPKSGSLTLVPALGILRLVGCHNQLQYDSFCFILYFILSGFGCYLLDTCSFLIKDRNGVDPEGEEIGRSWEK